MKCQPPIAKVTLSIIAAALLAGVSPVRAAAPTSTAAEYHADPRLQRHHRMGELMDQMQAQMGAMSKKMVDPKLTAQERKTMGEDMKRMSSMMRRMSGLVDRPSMKDAEARKQMDDMAKQMSTMQKRHVPAAAK